MSRLRAFLKREMDEPNSSKALSHSADPVPGSGEILPDDALAALIPSLSSLKIEFMLALACKRFLRVIPSKISTVSIRWTAKSELGAFMRILNRMRNISSLSVVIPSLEHLSFYSPFILGLSERLAELDLAFPFRNLAEPTARHLAAPAGFPNLRKLTIDFVGDCPETFPLHAFPQLRYLDIRFSGFAQPTAMRERFVEHLVRDCPLLSFLCLSGCSISREELSSLKGLKRLTRLRVDAIADELVDDIWRQIAPETLRVTLSTKNLRILIDKYADFINKYSPIGLAIEVVEHDLFDFALGQNNLSILAHALQLFKESKAHFDPHGVIRVARDLPALWDRLEHLDVLRLLIENGIDLGVQNTGDEKPKTVLEELIERAPSVEMFKLLFETKLAGQNKSMTAFEYAKSLHPEYPYFWETPIFTLALVGETLPGSMELIEYIAKNESRLLPLFGSSWVLGGPKIPDLSGKLPINFAFSIGIVEQLVAFGVDPWAPEMCGQLMAGCRARNARSPLFNYLVHLDSFDPFYRNPDGYSHLDLALHDTQSPLSSVLLKSFLDVGAITTEHTADLLMHHLVSRGLEASKQFRRIIKKLKDKDLPRVLKACFSCSMNNRLGGKMARFVLDQLGPPRINIATLEHELLSMANCKSLMAYVPWIGSVDCCQTLMFEVLQSPIASQILHSWRHKYIDLVTDSPEDYLPLLIAIGLPAPPEMEEHVKISILALRVALRIPKELLVVDAIRPEAE